MDQPMITFYNGIKMRKFKLLHPKKKYIYFFF